MNNSQAHSALINDALIALSRLHVLAWKNPTGQAVSATGAVIAFGLPGSSDIIGCIPPNGRLLTAEGKTGKGRLSDQQKKFAAAVAKRGGLHVTFRSVDELVMAVQHAMGSAAQAGWHV